MEAADSLFGPSDSGSDPFGSLLGSTEQSTQENAPLSHAAPVDEAGFFDSYSSGDPQGDQAWSGVQQQGVEHYASAANSADQGYYPDQNGYDQYAQWDGTRHQGSGAACE